MREAILGMENKVKDLRDKIDEIDLKILDLIQSRAIHASKIGEIKKESPDFDGVFYKPEREKEIIDRLTKKNSEPLRINNVKNIFKEIISACLSIEGELSISYLGPEGSFSDSAKKDHFGSSVTSQSESTIEGIFKSVEMGATNFGIVPFENSSQGVINTTLNCLSDFNIQICGETIVNIEHHLAAKKDIEISQIKKVVSHPQALGQCSKWITKNFRDINQVPMNSTAEAAKFVSNNDDCVAIVSDLAIEKYQLHCVARSIQDFKDNQTRFLVIGNFKPEIAEKNKSSFLIRTENKPGALLEILKPFNENNVNLFRIETRPSRSDRGSHDFFIDSEGHIDEKEMQQVIKKVKDVSSFIKVLGSYPMHS